MVNVELGEGEVGSCPDTDIDPLIESRIFRTRRDLDIKRF